MCLFCFGFCFVCFVCRTFFFFVSDFVFCCCLFVVFFSVGLFVLFVYLFVCLFLVGGLLFSNS